jgi:DNA topoisomerase-1
MRTLIIVESPAKARILGNYLISRRDGKRIKKALADPGQLNVSLVRAQEARRVVDGLMVYELSPSVSRALSQWGLSAGRVQSVALRLVVEREREITGFEPQECEKSSSAVL